jgi:geranyl diphosphate 2-C-methyltransferase
MVARAAAHYNAQRLDRNERMARDPRRINNHMGIGRYDGPPPEDLDQETLTGILDDLENSQTEYLVNRMGAVDPAHRALDAGCGRGGPAFALHARTGCRIDGVTVSEYQLEFARNAAHASRVDDAVRFHFGNYVDLPFGPASFDLAFTNETTMHAFRLGALFAELHRVLRPGGRYTLATWAANEAFRENEFLDVINRNYQCLIHTREEYVSSLHERGFELVVHDDLTDLAIPYWALRSHWRWRSGIESAFLEGHRSRKLLYLMISARKR